MANVNDFLGKLKNGLRANRYKVIINVPAGVTGDSQTISLMVRAATVPSMETGSQEILFKGETINVSGNSRRPAGEWAVTGALNGGQNPAEFKKLADTWQNLSFTSSDPTEYYGDATIEVLTPDTNETTVLKYKLSGLWLANSGELSLSDDTTDEMFTIELSFKYNLVEPVA